MWVGRVLEDEVVESGAKAKVLLTIEEQVWLLDEKMWAVERLCESDICTDKR